MRQSIPINIMVQANPTIARHIKHVTYLKIALKDVSIPCPLRTAWTQQSAMWTTWHKRNHFQSTRNKSILWTKSTRLLVRGPSMGPLPGHAFSNPIYWRIQNIIPIQAVTHTIPNTEGNTNGQGCEDFRVTHNRHPKYLKLTHNKHGIARSSLGKISTYIWQCNRKFRNTSVEQGTNTVKANHVRQHTGHTKGTCSRDAQQHTRYNTNNKHKYERWQRVFSPNSRFRGWPKEWDKNKLQNERKTRQENRELAK